MLNRNLDWHFTKETHEKSKGRGEKISNAPPCWVDGHPLVLSWMFAVEAAGVAGCHMAQPIWPAKDLHQHSAAQAPDA